MPNAIKALTPMTGKDESRYVICGMLMECRKDSITLVSTDGRRLAAIRIEPADFEGEEADYIVPNEILKKIKVSKRQFAVRLEFEEGRITIKTCEGDAFSGMLTEGKFPDWRMVVPSGEVVKMDNLKIDSDLIADYGTAIKVLGLRGGAVSLTNRSGSILVTTGLPNFFGVIMPMENSFSDAAPRWALKQQQSGN